MLLSLEQIQTSDMILAHEILQAVAYIVGIGCHQGIKQPVRILLSARRTTAPSILDDLIFHDDNDLPCEDPDLLKTIQDVPAETLTNRVASEYYVTFGQGGGWAYSENAPSRA